VTQDFLSPVGHDRKEKSSALCLRPSIAHYRPSTVFFIVGFRFALPNLQNYPTYKTNTFLQGLSHVAKQGGHSPPYKSSGPQGRWYWFSLSYFLFSKRKYGIFIGGRSPPYRPLLLLFLAGEAHLADISNSFAFLLS